MPTAYTLRGTHAIGGLPFPNRLRNVFSAKTKTGEADPEGDWLVFCLFGLRFAGPKAHFDKKRAKGRAPDRRGAGFSRTGTGKKTLRRLHAIMSGMTKDLERAGRGGREYADLQLMVAMHCRARHLSRTAALCADCRNLLEYARGRLGACVFLARKGAGGKPSCRLCPVHCYAPAEREAMRAIMRWAGPRMLLRHPQVAFRHLAAELAGPGRNRRR
jgi:hypothetical protein